jgi:hypothetical protein
MERKGGKGIDWWRYQYEILEAKLIPFAKECLQDRPDCEASFEGVYDRVPDSRRSGVGAEVGHVIV